jgi:small subunit ribosomal protein S6
MSRKYETCILFDPEFPEEGRKEFLAKIHGIIGSFGGELLKQDDWGLRKLAYPVNRKGSALYTFLLYTGGRGVVEEVERNIKIYDGALRHMTCLSTAEVKAKAPAAPAEEEAPAAPAAPAAEVPPAPASEVPPAPAADAPPAG